MLIVVLSDAKAIFRNLEGVQYLGVLLLVLVMAWIWIREIRIPWEVSLFDNGIVRFRGPFLSVSVGIEDIAVKNEQARDSVQIRAGTCTIRLSRAMTGLDELVEYLATSTTGATGEVQQGCQAQRNRDCRAQ